VGLTNGKIGEEPFGRLRADISGRMSRIIELTGAADVSSGDRRGLDRGNGRFREEPFDRLRADIFR